MMRIKTSTFAESYISVATCHLIDETEDELSAAVCLPNGFFVVLSPDRVLGSCEIGVHDVSKISLFHTYDAHCKHYLLSTKRSLLIVSHEKTLKVVKTFENISKFLIGDFTASGRSQLQVWLDGDAEPIIVDFKKQSPISSESPVTYSLHSRLQLLKVNLEHDKETLSEKQCLRKKTVKQLFYQNSENIKDINIQQQNSLVVKSTWQRLYLNKWILGAVVENTSGRTLTNVYLCSENSAITSKVLTKSLHLPDTIPNSTIDPGETAHIVGVLNPPSFPENLGSLDVSAAVLVQPGMPVASATWSLKASQVLDGSLTPFKGDFKDSAGQDVVALCAVAKIFIDLEIRSLGVLCEAASIHDCLAQAFRKLGFKGVPGAAQVIFACPSAGLLVKLPPASERPRRDCCRISLRAVEAREALVLIHALQDAFPDRVELTALSREAKETDSARALANALSAELQGIQSGKSRLDIASLELETDLALDRLGREQQ